MDSNLERDVGHHTGRINDSSQPLYLQMLTHVLYDLYHLLVFMAF